MIGVPHCKICTRTCLQDTIRSWQTERSCGIHREAAPRFLGRHAKQRARHVHHQERRQRGRRTRIVIGRQCDGNTRRAQGRYGWQLSLAQKIIGTGQQHGHRAGCRHRGHARVTYILQMIAAQCVELRCQRRTMLVAQLLGMKFDRQSQRLRRFKYATRLLSGEADTFAECIHSIDQPINMQSRHPVTHSAHVVIGPVFEFWRDCMCSQKRGAHSEWQLL